MTNRSRSPNRSLNPCLKKRENEKDYDYENDSLLPAGSQSIEFRLSQTDSYPLSVQAAGGGLHFTGALVGVHARME